METTGLSPSAAKAPTLIRHHLLRKRWRSTREIVRLAEPAAERRGICRWADVLTDHCNQQCRHQVHAVEVLIKRLRLVALERSAETRSKNGTCYCEDRKTNDHYQVKLIFLPRLAADQPHDGSNDHNRQQNDEPIFEVRVNGEKQWIQKLSCEQHFNGILPDKGTAQVIPRPVRLEGREVSCDCRQTGEQC